MIVAEAPGDGDSDRIERVDEHGWMEDQADIGGRDRRALSYLYYCGLRTAGAARPLPAARHFFWCTLAGAAGFARQEKRG
jgi:hypothetical protein